MAFALSRALNIKVFEFEFFSFFLCPFFFFFSFLFSLLSFRNVKSESEAKTKEANQT